MKIALLNFGFMFLVITNGFAQATVGLISQQTGSTDGYVLFAPISSTTTYLIDKCGYLVHSWPSAFRPGQSAYLLEDGTLLRSGKMLNDVFNVGGSGGKIEKLAWDGTVLWSYSISSTTECQHHDICPLPNGNVLAVVWDLHTPQEAIDLGRDPSLLDTEIWSEKIVEIHPEGINGGTVVWEWRTWDHMIQDFDETKANYGLVADHPELVNINFLAEATTPDWLHMNAVAYNHELNQIVVSIHNFSECWIIDHSTSTSEAASHNGGTLNHGGDLLYRWGNPEAYGRGVSTDKQFFGQHNVHWIPNGAPDAGKLMAFNNGLQRPEGLFSSIDIISPPITASGDYTITSNAAYLPTQAEWTYTDPIPTNFYGQNVSGAQRLPNGNTMICNGPKGTFFEINPAGATVWKYISPIRQMGAISTQGDPPGLNVVFRCTLYEPDYTGLAGQDLTPGLPIELSPLVYDCDMLGTSVEDMKTDNVLIRIISSDDSNLSLLSSMPLNNVALNLYHTDGRLIHSWNSLNFAENQMINLPLQSNLSSGAYVVSVVSNNQNQTLKFVVKQ